MTQSNIHSVKLINLILKNKLHSIFTQFERRNNDTFIKKSQKSQKNLQSNKQSTSCDQKCTITDSID